jgi:hypothetical protein
MREVAGSTPGLDFDSRSRLLFIVRTNLCFSFFSILHNSIKFSTSIVLISEILQTIQNQWEWNQIISSCLVH